MLQALTGGDTGVIHACVRSDRGGNTLARVRIVSPTEECDKHETSVHWNIAGPQGPPGEPGTARQPVTVVDANGIQVGHIVGGIGSLGSPLSPVVALKLGDVLVALPVSRDGFTGNQVVYFESSDCTGTGYMYFFSNVLFEPVGVIPPGQTVVVPDRSASPQSITVRSEVTLSRLPWCTPSIPGIRTGFIPVLLLGDLNTILGVTPPFSLEMR